MSVSVKWWKENESWIELKSGLTVHVIQVGKKSYMKNQEKGEKSEQEVQPAIVLCHGWPDFSYTFRHQMKALDEAGFRAIALDQRGFGFSFATKPGNFTDRPKYQLQFICQDLVCFLDALKLEKVVLLGHDWGGAVVWAMSVHHPERVAGVISICTPFYPPNPSRNPLQMLKVSPKRFDYQLYFQDEGVAEAELEKDVGYSIACIVRGVSDKIPGVNTEEVRKRGGLLVGCPPPHELKISSILSKEDFEYYKQAFTSSGFKTGIHWYRNIEENWKWNCQVAEKKVLVPCLMITASKDLVLTPEMTIGMEEWVPNLSRFNVSNAGHWCHQEYPQQVNQVILQWLDKWFPQAPSKL